MAVKSELGEGGFEVWNAWSQSADSYRAADARSVWKSIHAGKVGVGSIFHLAKQHGWRPDRAYAPVSPAELLERRERQEAARRKSEAEEAARHQEAAAKARLTRNASGPCESHPCLEMKGVKSHGLRVGDWPKWIEGPDGWREIVIPEALLIPMTDEHGDIWNLQAIFPEKHPELDRDKDFISGGRKAGLFFTIGEPTDSLLIAEGFATAATVHEATGYQTFVAFDCGNLKAVALTIRRLNPGKRIIICGDNDRFTNGNPGVTKAREAALAVGGYVSIPEFPDGVEGTDWNDLMLFNKGVRHG
jgi:putative DNA primase/helicase